MKDLLMKFRSILVFAIIVLALSACSLADDITPPPGYQSPVPQPTMGPLFPANPPDLAVGAAIFVEKCAPCHGSQGLGDGPQAADLPKQPTALGKPETARAASPANWYITVTQGKIDTFMPPFRSLDDQERWDVVAYSLSLSVASAEQVQGKAVYDANCANCHGADGKKLPKSDFTDQARMAKLSLNDLIGFINTGVESMPGFEATLSQADRYAVAAYARAFTFTATQATVSPTATSGAADTTPIPENTGTSEPAQVETPDAIVGAISGKIVNKSGGSVPANLKVVLHVFQHDSTNNQFEETNKQETTAGADGAYSFADLQMPASQAFYVSVDYANTTYQSDPVIPTVGQTVYDLPINIYDTTTDSSGLIADQAHILLDYSKENIIQVIEFYIISNPGTKTIVPQGNGAAIVTLALPKGYANLQFQDGQLGDRYIQTADGFGDTLPVPPGAGQYQLVFAYDLPYSENFEFTQPFPLNIASITFLVSEGVKATGPNILDGGVKDMGNGSGAYQLYTVDGRKAGESLKVTVSGKPGQAAAATSVAGTDSTQNIIIGVGSLGLALVLAGVWLFWRDRKRADDDDEALPEEEDSNADEILDAIIALDDQHNAGNIADEAYQQRRAELKERFKKIENSE